MSSIFCGKVHRLAPPPDVVHFLTEYGGRNIYYDPLFRVVWANSRLAWKAGRWEDRYAGTDVIEKVVVEARRVPKYPQARDRFVVEHWNPPELYGSPEEWRRVTSEVIDGQTVDILGEYPARGDYEWLDTVESFGCECGKMPFGYCAECKSNSRFIEPTVAYVKFLVDAYNVAKEGVAQVHLKQKAAVEAEDRARRARALEMVQEAAPLYAGMPSVGYTKG